MPYQYVREPLTAEESDRLSNACETPTERLVVRTLLDTGLRVGELCDLTPKNVLWQQRQLRIKGKGGPHGKKTKVRVVPMSNRVRTLLEHHFALEKTFPVKARRAQDIVKAVAHRALPCQTSRTEPDGAPIKGYRPDCCKEMVHPGESRARSPSSNLPGFLSPIEFTC